MKRIVYFWYEVTIRYYNPAIPMGKTTETIAVEVQNELEAESRVLELYKDFPIKEILSIKKALFQDVYFEREAQEGQHWYLAELAFTPDGIQDYEQDLKKEGANCLFLSFCHNSCEYCTSNFREECFGFTDNLNRCPCDPEEILEYIDYGTKRTIDVLDCPKCFQFGCINDDKIYALIPCRDFSQAYEKFTELLDLNYPSCKIFSITESNLCEVYPWYYLED